jgi:hypothetical protein
MSEPDPRRHLESIDAKLPTDVPMASWSGGELALDGIRNCLLEVAVAGRSLDADLRRLVASTMRAIAGDIEP